MSDVLKIALDRRESLHAEAAKLNEFIRYGESLMRGVENGEATIFEAPPMAQEPPAENVAQATAERSRPSLIRRWA